jgi:hypothetical protein
MGLLDDAIREHLDLKRRRGADPAEIERAEREALGPVRRSPEPAAPSDPNSEARYGYEEYGEPEREERFAPIAGTFPDEPPEYEEPTSDHEPAARYESLLERDAAAHEEPLQHETPAQEDDREEDPLGQAGGRPPEQSQRRSDETAEYDVERELRTEGEDVLEETPEFLQDAPEHDRLWFEQRPPRDFDFNE